MIVPLPSASMLPAKPYLAQGDLCSPGTITPSFCFVPPIARCRDERRFLTPYFGNLAIVNVAGRKHGMGLRANLI